jgi:hypothetical protein
MVVIELSNAGEVDKLMTAAQYDAFLANQKKGRVSPPGGHPEQNPCFPLTSLLCQHSPTLPFSEPAPADTSRPSGRRNLARV